jgi:hypothetical protein
LFQENAASHKAATKHQKLADLILKFWNTRPTHLICPLGPLPPSQPQERPLGKKVFEHCEGHICYGRAVCSKNKIIFLDRLTKLKQRSHKRVEIRWEYVG